MSEPTPPPPSPPPRPSRAAVALWASLMSVVVLVAWGFPRWWYTRTDPTSSGIWLVGLTNLTGWTYQPQPIGTSEERQLAADALHFGTYARPNGEAVRLFTAERVNENPHLLGLFVHTPDFCWSQAGWSLEPTTNDQVRLTLHGTPITVERRVFRAPSGHRELVYFFGLVGGQPLPYRLDHNYAIARRSTVTPAGVRGGAKVAGLDTLLWQRVWEAFRERRPLLGPKQFVRISTSLAATRGTDPDDLLRDALNTFLTAAPMPGVGGTPLGGTPLGGTSSASPQSSPSPSPNPTGTRGARPSDARPSASPP